jgi:hypothetical protein
MKKLLKTTFAIILGLYLLVAWFGYLTFTYELNWYSNLLKLLSHQIDAWYVQIANIIMIFSLIAAFPTTTFGLLKTID